MAETLSGPPEIHGPIDFVLVEFPGQRFPDEVAIEAMRLVESTIIRLYDVLVIVKDASGRARKVDLAEGPPEMVGALAALAGARSGLLNDEDFEKAAAAVDPDHIAVILVFENAWAIPFVGAALAAQGDVVASSRIPAQDVIDALETLEVGG